VENGLGVVPMKAIAAFLMAVCASGCALGPPAWTNVQLQDRVVIENAKVLSVIEPASVSGILKTWTIVVIDGGRWKYDLYLPHMKTEGEAPRYSMSCSIVAEARLIDGQTRNGEIDRQKPVFVPTKLVCRGIDFTPKF
jgi:hypothetical protein